LLHAEFSNINPNDMKKQEKNRVKTEMVASYKGRRYQLLYIGRMKQGDERALLMYFDGSRKFWVDGKKVSEIEEKRKGNSSAKPNKRKVAT
jgi:hypothetical protein